MTLLCKALRTYARNVRKAFCAMYRMITSEQMQHPNITDVTILIITMHNFIAVLT